MGTHFQNSVKYIPARYVNHLSGCFINTICLETSIQIDKTVESYIKLCPKCFIEILHEKKITICMPKMIITDTCIP